LPKVLFGLLPPHNQTNLLTVVAIWLINTESLALEYFAVPDKAPPYAILSNMWGEEEVASPSSAPRLSPTLLSRRKISVIKKTCGLDQNSNIRYAWVDTCCIDKSSSAELSEAINSMFNFYQRPEICYAFISDWAPGWNGLTRPPLGRKRPDGPLPPRWFARGWTLQELLAPAKVQFHYTTWRSKGFKQDRRIVPELSRVTGVSERVQHDGSKNSLSRVCLAQRMSWAAHRETSGVEDISYYLLGIFQVNMNSTIRGGRAFYRLQQELINNTTDLSWFAWSAEPVAQGSPLFAPWPKVLVDLGACSFLKSGYDISTEMRAMNKGIRLESPRLYFTTRKGLKIPGRLDSKCGSVEGISWYPDLYCTADGNTPLFLDFFRILERLDYA